MMRFLFSWLAFMVLVAMASSDEDYYKLLGIEKDADDRTIRKAFKKLAIQKHPDKNKDNPNAHAEFVKINKAYEVLKDEEMRKKYDQYGEKGLEDGFQGGNNYQSWQFYNENFGKNFPRAVLRPPICTSGVSCSGSNELGIYDDDAEIVTLNRADFTHFVSQSNELWFINFYSTYCSHCHQLAPTRFERSIFFCSVCRKKLAIMLDGLVNVGSIDCRTEVSLCDSLNVSKGVRYYPHGKVEKHYEKPTAVFFVPNRDSLKDRKDYKKLSPLLPDVKILFADCSKFMDLCRSVLDVSKLPQFVSFKTTGGYEIDYVNKASYHDVSVFIKDSQASPLHVLDEVTYQQALNSDQLWIIDYFAPWCPPCLRLISEYRRLHSIIDPADVVTSKIRIGLVDCQKYSHICQNAGVQRSVPVPLFVYPTSALHTLDNRVHRFVGYHTGHSLLGIINNALNPAVEELTPSTFVELVERREGDTTWIVDFFAPWCGPCQQLAPELQRAARALRQFDEQIHVGSIDCQEYDAFCKQISIPYYPSIRLYPAVDTKRRKSFYEYPQNMWRNADSIELWVHGMLPSKVTAVGNDFWTKVLDSDEPWMVDFFAPWCGHCVHFSPVYEHIAKVRKSVLSKSLKSNEVLDGKVKLAKVDCDQWPGVCQGAQIHSYPTVRFYKGRQHNGKRQDIWGLQLDTQDKNTIVRIVLEHLEHLRNHDEL
uniref:DnaJ homolog subfamily C member 10 n=1 Tax=Angiostrongylus cantonensis TaxID=6313 RepID=A0A158PBG7_ANGCA